MKVWQDPTSASLLVKWYFLLILFLMFLFFWLNGMNISTLELLGQGINHELELILDPSLMEAFTESLKTESTS